MINSISQVKFNVAQTFQDARGGLSVIEELSDIPFEISRVFYTYGTNPQITRGAHAHKSCWQALICVSGSLDVEFDDSLSKGRHTLDSPEKILVIPPLIWSTQLNYSDGAVCLVLASERFFEDEYLRNYQGFIEYRSQVNR